MTRKDLIQLRRDTAANWTSVDPVLAEGEIGVEIGTGNLKVGDGSTAWSGLSYVGAGGGAAWGTISGTLSSQTDLQTELDARLTDAPSDGNDYARNNGAWAQVTGGGVTDHGALTGLADDDHTQYHNDARGDARYYTQTQLDTSLDARAPRENGFEDRSESTLSFVDGTRTFTITPTGASFDVFVQSTRYTISSADSVVISDVEGLHYIYYNAVGTLVETTTFSESIITDFAFVCAIDWDVPDAEAILVADERHGATMDSQTHLYNHNTFGTRFGSGLGLTGITADGDGDLAASAQCGVNDGVIWDEDIDHTITDGSPQELSPIAQIPMFYRSGASGDWRRITATNFPVTTTGTGRAAWNEWTGATWQLTEVVNNHYVFTHLLATGDINHPIIGIVGHTDYSSISNARDNANEELRSLQLGGLTVLTPEFYAIATIIFQTSNTYSNAVQSRVRSTEDSLDYIDWREIRSGSGLIEGDTEWGTIIGTLSSQTDLQAALDAKSDTTHTHTLSDVTDSGALAALNTVGSAQIDAEAVTNVELAHVATDTIKGRTTAGTGDVEDMTPAQVRTMLNVADGATNNSGALADLDSVDTPEINASAVGEAQIADEAVTLPKLAHMATDSFLGRDTAATGDVEVLSAATARTILNVADGATADQSLANADQDIGNVTRNIDGSGAAANFWIDLDNGSGQTTDILMQPNTPRILIQTAGGGNTNSIAIGSSNINIVLASGAPLQVNGAAGTSGQVLTSNGSSAAPTWQTGGGGGGGTTIGLLSATRATSQTIGTAFGTFVWDTPGLNQDTWTYSAGVFTVPSGINGAYLEFNITLMHDNTGVNNRAQWTGELQKDTGSGYVTMARFSNYTARNTAQDEGGIHLSYIDPTAAATGDDWRVQVLRIGLGTNSSTNGCFISIKSYT